MIIQHCARSDQERCCDNHQGHHAHEFSEHQYIQQHRQQYYTHTCKHSNSNACALLDDRSLITVVEARETQVHHNPKQCHKGRQCLREYEDQHDFRHCHRQYQHEDQRCNQASRHGDQHVHVCLGQQYVTCIHRRALKQPEAFPFQGQRRCRDDID